MKKTEKIKKTFYENGNVKQQYEVNEDGRKDGYFKQFHENGQLRAEASFTNDKQNPGTIVSYHENGIKAREVVLTENGNFNGNFIEWYENGNIKIEGYYKEDEIFINKEFNQDGTVIEKQLSDEQNGIFIPELGLEQITYSDLLGLYDESELEEIQKELSIEGSYSDEWLEFYKDDDSEKIECTLLKGSFEIIDHINNMKICEDDPYIMIVKDAWFGDNEEGDEFGYISFEALNNDDDPPTLKGGEYDKKSFMNEEELAEFDELSENESIMYDVKYQEFYFVRTSIYNVKEWIENWFSQDYGHNN